KEHFGLLNARDGQVLTNKWDTSDIQAIAPAEHVEHTIAADDPRPSERRSDGEVHFVASNEDPGDDQRNILGDGKPQAAEKQHSEEDGVADASAIHQIEDIIDVDLADEDGENRWNHLGS